MQLILQDFKNRFGITETKYVTAGTPKTFERYTGRQSGYVGGLPFLYGMNPWSIPGHTTQLQNIYRVGDTTFPGQGLVGVVAGSLALDQQITAKLSHR
jgi:phytoene dehydrogenase-like protein